MKPVICLRPHLSSENLAFCRQNMSELQGKKGWVFEVGNAGISVGIEQCTARIVAGSL